MEKRFKTVKEVKADRGNDLSQGEKNDARKKAVLPPLIPPQKNGRKGRSRDREYLSSKDWVGIFWQDQFGER